MGAVSLMSMSEQTVVSVGLCCIIFIRIFYFKDIVIARDEGICMHLVTDIATGRIRSQAGFALFATWITLVPRAMVSSSGIVSAHPFIAALSFVAALMLTTAFDRFGADRVRSNLFTVYSVFGTFAIVVFLLMPDTTARLACFGVQMIAATGLLLGWGRLLSTQTMEVIRDHALSGLLTIALFHFAVLGLGSVAGMVNNLHALSNLMLAALAIALPLSDATAWPALRNHSIPDRPQRDGAENDGEVVSLVLPFLFILCLVSSLTSLMSGFIYLPLYYDWNLIASLKSGIILTAAVFAIIYTIRRPVLTVSEINGFFLFGLLLTIGGFLLSTWADINSGLIARSLLEAARDCYFVLTFSVLCGMVHQRRVSFSPFFSLGVLGSGLYWSFDIGVLSRKFLGYDLSILGPLASLCIAVLAFAFFLLFARNPLSTQTKTASCPAGEGNEGDTSSDDQSVVSITDGEQPPTPLDAASARQVIERTYEEILTPYRLSPRETQVSLLMLDGYTAAGASAELDISIATVKFHLGNCYRKIGIQSKAELVALTKSGRVETTECATRGISKEVVHES